MISRCLSGLPPSIWVSETAAKRHGVSALSAGGVRKWNTPELELPVVASYR